MARPQPFHFERPLSDQEATEVTDLLNKVYSIFSEHTRLEPPDGLIRPIGPLADSENLKLTVLEGFAGCLANGGRRPTRANVAQESNTAYQSLQRAFRWHYWNSNGNPDYDWRIWPPRWGPAWARRPWKGTKY